MKWILVFGLGVILAAGCSKHSRNSADRSVTGSDIVRTVKARFETEPSIPEGIKVTADANRSRITLSGAVPSKEVRNRAVELAKSSSPGAVVVDELQVQPAEVPRTEYTDDMARADRDKAKTLGDSIGHSADDAWIHSTIVRKLLRDPETPVANIHVDVRNGVVTLRGHVDTDDQKAEAGNVAQATDGVKRVNNRLLVKA